MNLKMKRIDIGLGKLTQEQKKIIAGGIIALITLALFIVFIYGPQSRKFAEAKRSLEDVEAQIDEIMNITKGRELPEVARDLRAEFTRLKEKFAAEEDDIVYQLAESAKKAGIEVKNIDPAESRPLGISVAGYAVAELPITIEMSCDYRALGEYLDMLSNKFKYLIRVKDLSVNGRGRGRPDLGIVLHVKAFLSQ